MQPNEQLITVKDLASILKVTDRTIYNMIEKERIPFYRIGTDGGGDYRFNKEEVLTALIKNNR